MSGHKIELIDKSSLVDEVENSIIKFLVRNKFKPGDPMPKEVDLAESMGVSRSVIREALSRLKMLGILKSTKRRGLEVSHPDVLIGLDRVIIPEILDWETMEDLFELRLILEMGIAEILFIRKKDKDIAELREILKKERGSKNRVISIQSEVEFHGKLYEIAGNSTLKRMQSILWPVFDFLEKKEMEEDEDPHTSRVTHEMLVDIIEHGTPVDYQQAIKKHLKVHLDRIFNEGN